MYSVFILSKAFILNIFHSLAVGSPVCFVYVRFLILVHVIYCVVYFFVAWEPGTLTRFPLHYIFQQIIKRTAVDSCHAALLNTIHYLCQLKQKKTTVQLRKREHYNYVRCIFAFSWFFWRYVITNIFILVQQVVTAE